MTSASVANPRPGTSLRVLSRKQGSGNPRHSLNRTPSQGLASIGPAKPRPYDPAGFLPQGARRVFPILGHPCKANIVR